MLQATVAVMREDEIEALCALHGARLIVHRDLAGTGFIAHIYGKETHHRATSEQDRVTAVQQAWQEFDEYYRAVNLLKQEKQNVRTKSE